MAARFCMRADDESQSMISVRTSMECPLRRVRLRPLLSSQSPAPNQTAGLSQWWRRPAASTAAMSERWDSALPVRLVRSCVHLIQRGIVCLPRFTQPKSDDTVQSSHASAVRVCGDKRLEEL
jgi:hypothetical protein